ncbi:MAG TPA: hypothetical protein DGP25_09670 [Brevundimonas sp.]|nr:hypothetical protein [Brevundimonas sp.]
MAEEGRAPTDRAAIFFAMKEIAAHPSVASVSDPVFSDSGTSINVVIDIGLGNRFRKQGGDINGVYPREEVRFDFPTDFPTQAPSFSLRQDFSRNHPHIQPWLVDGRVVPCVVDGGAAEFIATRGLFDLIDQLRLWLENAALGRLMDPEQGWEPTRRDGYSDIIIADASKLRALVTRDGGWKLFKLAYGFRTADDFTPFFFGEIGEETNVKTKVGQSCVRDDSAYGRGEGLAIVVWPGKQPNGGPIVTDAYLPDDFRTVGELCERLDRFGTSQHLTAPLKLLNDRAASQGTQGDVFPLVVINLVRRPYRLIGSDSDIEICPYVLPLRCPQGAMSDPGDEVRPMAQRDALTPAVLRRSSGDPPLPAWALLGCGSLGSKLALHLTRSGNSPTIVADRSMLHPHNAARHALYPSGGALQMDWIGSKADALATALKGLGAPVEALGDDHAALVTRLIETKEKAKPAWLLNTTASMIVQGSLAQDGMTGLPRVVEMGLYDGGRLGYVGVEGADHNPNAVELEAVFYQEAASNPAIARHLFTPVDGAASIVVGQGCSSLTIRMSDAALDAMAAPMAEIFTGLQIEEPGSIHVLRREGIGLAHASIEVPKLERVALEGMDGWRLSLTTDVQRRIMEEAAEHPKTETGGVLIGWSSAIARQIIVTDLIPAPADSKRSRTKFELGVDGVSEKLAEIHARSGELLRCVGTWHSHLGSAAPSLTDKTSAALVGAGYVQPMAFLILGTDGWRGVSFAARLIDTLPEEKG